MSRPLPNCGEGEMLLPQSCRIVPSNIDPWRGARRPDQRYTNPQLGVMPLYKLDPETCEDVVVVSSVSQSEYWWPAGRKNPVYLCPCPIIDRRLDGSQCLVISPAGMKKWVYSDGSITKRRIGEKREFARRGSRSSVQWTDESRKDVG